MALGNILHEHPGKWVGTDGMCQRWIKSEILFRFVGRQTMTGRDIRDFVKRATSRHE